MKKLLLLIVVLVLGCTYSVRPKNESLREAWYKYWSYKQRGEFKKAFYYENISFLPHATPERYAQGMAGTVIKGFRFIEIGKEGSGPHGSTPIKMKLITKFPPMLGLKGDREVIIKDYWIKKKGRWYHLKPGLTGYY